MPDSNPANTEVNTEVNQNTEVNSSTEVNQQTTEVNTGVNTEVQNTLTKPEPTGNQFFDSVQDVFYSNGIDHSKYLQERIDKGELSAESRSELIGKLGEAQVKIIEQGFDTEFNKIKSAQAEEDKKVFDSINLPGYTDGAKAFEVIAEWCKTGITEEERQEYNALLKQGGMSAKLAMQSLKEKYMSNPNYTAPANLESGTNVAAPTGIEPISRAVYIEELRKAEQKRDRATVEKLNAQAKYTMANKPEVWRPY